MRIAIVGSRDFPDLSLVRKYVRSLPPGTTVVSGGARGVDRAAERAAERMGLDTLVLIPDWDRHGTKAGFLRNRDIVDNADALIAFQHERSRGTQHSIDLARKKGIPVKVVST